MRKSAKRLAVQVSLSAIVAVATPAVAAGLVAGTSVALETSNTAIGSTIYPKNDSATTDGNTATETATHGPARLSALAGTDREAWNSARAVHMNFVRKPH